VTSPDLVLTGLVEAQTSLDPLTRWQFRPATVTIPGATAVLVKFDGEGFDGTEAVNVPAISLIGYLMRGARVMVMFVPPAGNYVVADLSGATAEYESLLELSATASTTYVSTNVGASLIGVSFIVPASGKVAITWGAECSNSIGTFTLVTIQIAEGPTIDAGSIVKAASDDDTARADTTAIVRVTNFIQFDASEFFISPGTVLNVTLYHRVNGGSAAISRRRVSAVPMR
jgi:hypothetical protein